MSRAVALSRIQELGVRGRDDPPVEPLTWAGMAVNANGLRALHEALHPTLLLLALCGYRIEQLVVGPPVGGDILLVTLSPRSAVAMSWAEYMQTDVDWPSTAPHAVLMWLEPRPGVTGGLVTVDATGLMAQYVRDVGGFDFLMYGVAAADLGALANAIVAPQAPVRTELALRMMRAWMDTDWALTTAGLLAALQPDFWTFPKLTDDEDLQRDVFRALGEPIAAAALDSEVGLLKFLSEEAAVRGHNQPPSVHDRLLELAPDDAEDLERGWNTEAEVLWNRQNPDAGRDPFRAADHRRLSYTEMVFDMLNESLISLAGLALPSGESAYGGYDLQRGDIDPLATDAQWTYGGETVVGQAGAPRPTYIKELREDLEKIGFGPLADGDWARDQVVDGTTDPAAGVIATRRRGFGQYLEAAVREFQIYAAMDNVARVGRPGEVPIVLNPSLATSLVPQVNDEPYLGPASGVLNAETRTLLKMWVERDWHCPIVIEARVLSPAELLVLRDPNSTANKELVVTNKAIAAAHHNIWRRTQLEDGSYTFIAWDLTKHYPAPVTRPWMVPVAVARWTRTGSWGGAFAKVARQTWPEAEVRPDTIYDAFPDPAQRPQQGPFWSTFRVIRAISEAECQGVIDGMNAYDSAIVSGGPVHFTLGLAKLADGTGLNAAPQDCVVYPGELCPSLSLFAAENAEEYQRFFGDFALQPLEEWDDPPTEMFSSGHRKYRGWIRLQDENGVFVDPRVVSRASVAAGEPLAVHHEDFLLIEVLHHWHWIYRWQMAPRLSQAFREITYRLARARLRALLSTPWGGLGGAPAGLTLGDIFTSEKAVAILERIHVYSPETLFGVSDYEAEWGGQTTADISFTPIVAAYTEAKKTGGADPSTWGDDQEKVLVTQLIAANLKADIATLVLWPVQTDWTDNKYGMDLLPIVKEEAPDIGAIAPLAVAPGTETRVPFAVVDRETEPGGCTVTAKSSNQNRVVASVESAGGIDYELVLAAPAGATGEVTVTVTARDVRNTTTRGVRVRVSSSGALPTGTAPAYVRPAPVGLSEQRHSFELDDDGLFTQPPN